MATAISAKEVGELRNRTGAGMMDCKKALEETGGDMDKAIELLRSKGAAKAEKRSGRQTKEGMIASYIHHNGKIAVLVELNCETDFVARTDDFQQLGKWIAEHVAAAAPLAIDKDQVPQDKVESERRIFIEQVKAEGKPDHMIDKIVEGKIQAFYKDVALMHQAWVAEEDDRRSREGDFGEDWRERPGASVCSLPARGVVVTLPPRAAGG